MASAQDLTPELAARLEEIEDLRATLDGNERKLSHAQRQELKLLQADDLPTLFLAMLEGLRKGYRLEYVSVVICDPDHDIRHLLMTDDSTWQPHERLLLVESLTGLAPQYAALREPWRGAYAAHDHQLVMPGAARVRSVVMVPLTHRGNLIGSINFGSANAARFVAGQPGQFLGHLGVIASFCIENAVNRARLTRSQFTDVLTGWHNRRYLQVRLKEELARARRDGKQLVCLMLDIDHFKRVNDTWGHAAGDSVLRELARRIDSQVRASDVAARYGGEEFVVLMPDSNKASGVLLAERIRGAVSAWPCELPGGETVRITVSIGIASVRPTKGKTDFDSLGDALLSRADVALYRAKAAGRDRIEIAADGD